jgi:hypothetical protein
MKVFLEHSWVPPNHVGSIYVKVYHFLSIHLLQFMVQIIIYDNVYTVSNEYI